MSQWLALFLSQLYCYNLLVTVFVLLPLFEVSYHPVSGLEVSLHYGEPRKEKVTPSLGFVKAADI